MVNGNDIGTSVGNNQTNCNDDGFYQMCDVNGVSDTASPIEMNWSGVHTSLISATEDCSLFEGTWMATGPGGNNFSGTYISDIPVNRLRHASLG